ncbi:MAG TPA: CopG family transcriptional regulator [Candidatus Angelobacter sp.]|nr:CopG family transcriptional regulator [Candidatus Angelobacter sp.]
MTMAGLIGTFGAGAFTGSKQEKFTVAMDAAGLAQIDQLIEQGLYSSREDFLQTAACNLLQKHGVAVAQAASHITVAGMAMHNRKSLEKLRAMGKQLELNITGMLRLADDVTPELACAVIKSLKIRGTFHASVEVKAALTNRIR